ncbi:Imm50 family immunity protein [Kitasatospora sp. NPDC050543]|uniref:Imm50 family immunity protein n=1 Tax=Kitasatospora sp. NPDC050543 TaxID=3364054 RepID=UPI0037B601BB
MTDRDWSCEVANPETLREVLGTPPPPLTDYALISVHIDEREASVTLGFFAFAVPAGAAALWHAQGHNAVEFFLVCTHVENLAVDGWSTDPITAVTLDGTSVVLAGPGKRVSFEAGEIHAQAPVGRLASSAQ